MPRAKHPGRKHIRALPKRAELIAELGRALSELEARPGLSAEERGRWLRLRHEVEKMDREKPILPATIDPADLSDLPPALLQELSIAHADPLEAQIIAVLQGCGGSADLDQILIGLYRRFDTIQKRRSLQNKLWRMVRKGTLRKAKAERGIFSLEAPNARGRKGCRAK